MTESRISQLEKCDYIRRQLQHADICLEPLLPHHAPAMYELATQEIMRLTRLAPLSNESDAMNRILTSIAALNTYAFAINHRALGFIGVISIKVIGDAGHFYFWIGEPFWGNGFATAATCQLLRFAFDELELEELFTSVFAHNHRSIRIMRKLGFSSLRVIRRDLHYYRCGLSQLPQHETTVRPRRLFPPNRSNLMNQSNNNDGGQLPWPK